MTLSWGMYGNDSVYTTFNEARQWTAVSPPPSFWTSPVYFIILWLATGAGLQVELVSLIINGLCWGGTAVLAVHLLAVRKEVAIVTAVLMTLSPILHIIAGTPTTLYLFVAFLALYLTRKQAWLTQTLTLLLLPLLHFDLGTFFILLALLALRWHTTGRFPAQATALLLALYSFWTVLVGLTLDLTSWFTFSPSLTNFLAITGQLLWLLIPLAGLGLLSLRNQSIMRVVVSWTTVSLLVSGQVGVALTAVTIWLFAGYGLHYLLNFMHTNNPRILGIIALPLLALSLWALGQEYSIRPVIHANLEKETAIWLQANSQPQNSLTASARILYNSQRMGTVWIEETTNQFPDLSNAIQTDTPDYLVTARTISFDQLQQAAWFQENYVALQQFNSAYESIAPLTIWGYRPTIYDLGEGRPLNVQTNHNLNIIGYQYEPTRLQPGQELHLTLFLQATQPITIPLNAWLRLTPFNNSQEWVRQITPLTAVSTSNTIHPQTITTTVPTNTPVGAYQLSFSLQEQGQENVLALYRNNDVNVLDRINLGNIIVLEEVTTDETIPINASFGDQITLLSYALSSQADTLILDLFWQANQSPNSDYVVFVHLLGTEEQLIANQDTPPLDGRFPTSAWLPNDIIPDRHILPLDPDTKGTYQLNIGLYHPQTGERLPILTNEGTPAPNNSLPLQTIEK